MSDMILLTRREENALRYVDHLARCLYMALRWSMNFKTGVVGGPEKAISWQSLREDTEVPGRPGIKAIKPSEQQLRRRAKQLELFGLIESIGDKLRLRFRMLLARSDKNAPKKPDTSAIAPAAARKPKPRKPSQGYPQTDSAPKADTHPASDKTLNPPPTPSGLRPDGDGTAIDPPAPAAREDHNPNGDETPGGAEAQRLSEERHGPAVRGGGWPAAGHSDEEAKPDLTWEAHLAWPIGIEQRQRAYIARSTKPLGKTLAQLVLDEWHGAMLAGVVAKPWPYFNSLLKAAREQGHAWETKYAEGVEVAREDERVRLANLAAQEAAYQASLGQPGPMPAGALGQFAKSLEAQRAARRMGRGQ
ncbi:hypothetical protein [Cupriavidus sp. WS]|uniref:hypothetical protein n=1 Tax=Cupriavidus sp. WS TaxID=1312922 RepID=UPI000369ECE4|nr:hypothetical protein [Cupriavidus sp. WS]